MSEYYTAQRTMGLYHGPQGQSFKLSRSKVDLFLECPRCFYYDRKLGVSRPPGFPFTLNSAVDKLLKKEFDVHRAQNKKHPLMEKYGIDALPVAHEKLEDWRNTFKGIQFLHRPTNFLVYGAIDDLWQNPEGEYIVVDYKATAKNEEITALDKDWHVGYKRQMEIYQWLLRQNGFLVSDTGYFVYCNGKADKQAFDAKLEFDITVIPYTGNDAWVEQAIVNAYECLNGNEIPISNGNCDYCSYIHAIGSRG